MLKSLSINHKKNLKNRAQVLIEFSFAMIVIFLMIYAATMIFRWSALDLAEKRIQHEEVLTSMDGDQNYLTPGNSLSLKQVDPMFYKPIEMNAIYDNK